MTVTVQSVTESDIGADEWNRLVDRSPNGTVFHRYEALEVQAEHVGADSHLLLGTKGEEPVGVFPLFERRYGPLSVAFSPPPSLRVPYLGPALLNMAKLKRRKRDRRLRQFIEGSLEWVRDEIDPAYTHVRTAYGDIRPFVWYGCRAVPKYTYVVDLTDSTDVVLASCSSDLRRNVRNVPEGDYAIEEGGPDEIATILEQVSARYDAQDISYHVTPAFVFDLYRRLPDGHVRPYVCSVEGSVVGGIVALEDGGTVYRWQGGVRPDGDVDLPINDLLDWRIIRDGIARGVAAYDLVGANDSRISTYKAKFNPDLASYYTLELGGPLTTRIAHLYRRLR